jgi:hypothetical protein
VVFLFSHRGCDRLFAAGTQAPKCGRVKHQRAVLPVFHNFFEPVGGGFDVGIQETVAALAHFGGVDAAEKGGGAVAGKANVPMAARPRLVNAPSFQLQNGRAKVPDLLQLSHNSRDSYAPTCGQIQTRRNEASQPGEGVAASSSVADGRIAGAGDDGPILASDAV